MIDTKDEVKRDITKEEHDAFIRAIHNPETREKIIAILKAGGLLS